MNIKASHLTRLLAAFFLLPFLLLGSGGLHMQASAHSTHSSMASSDKDCLSLCTSRLNTPEAVLGSREEDKDNEPKPGFSVLYYLQFTRLANASERIGNDRLLKHLQWRPPDLFKLYANYRM